MPGKQPQRCEHNIWPEGSNVGSEQLCHTAPKIHTSFHVVLNLLFQIFWRHTKLLLFPFGCFGFALPTAAVAAAAEAAAEVAACQQATDCKQALGETQRAENPMNNHLPEACGHVLQLKAGCQRHLVPQAFATGTQGDPFTGQVPKKGPDLPKSSLPISSYLPLSTMSTKRTLTNRLNFLKSVFS